MSAHRNTDPNDISALILDTCKLIVLAPLALIAFCIRAWGARHLLKDALTCHTCETKIPLTGMWKCKKCNFVFYGFFFAKCKVCRGVPSFINCPACGASTRNPLIVWWWRREQRG